MTARTCDHPVAADQRYCLVCGDACAPPRVDWLSMVRPHGVATPPATPLVDGTTGLRLPTPRIAAALVLGTLGFGVLVGGAAGPAAAGGQPRQLIIVRLPAPAPASTTPAEPVTPEDSGDVALEPTAAAAEPESTETPAAQEESTPPAADNDEADENAEAPAEPSPVKHVWILALRGTPFTDPVAAPYLAGELREQGTLLTAFAAPSDDPVITGTAVLSGTTGDAATYPAKVATLADRVTGAGQVWKAYVDTPPPAPGESLCLPTSPLADRNPLLRFTSITAAAECGSQVAPIEQLARDAETPDGAPVLSYLVPAVEHDGADVAATDVWARTTIDAIRGSKAYADGGLIVVLGGATTPTAAAPPGALLISPLLKAGGTQGGAIDAYGLTRTLETVLGLPALETPLTKDASPLDTALFST